MARPTQLGHAAQALEKQLGSFVNLPKVAAPFTTITNRALVTDFSKDLLPKMGVERFHVQQVVELPEESVSTSDRVYRPINDLHNQVRFAGTWVQSTGNDGFSITSGVIGDFIEVVFYGTGINILMVNLNTADRGFTLFVDGVSVATLNTISSTVLQGRTPPSNVVIAGTSGLTLGLHTARFVKTTANNSNVVGFETVCVSGTSPSVLQLPSGSAFVGSSKLAKSALSVDSYNSNFQSGTLGTKGGRVLVYLDTDGLVKKALIPTDTSQLNMSAASHTNEQLIRVYNWREFSSGRTDDFSFVTGSAPLDRAYTLDDGTTTLVGDDVGVITADFLNGSRSVSGGIWFTFVGTGLDVSMITGGGTAATVYVNGTSLGTLPATLTNTSVQKIVSGLPYGTHVVRIQTGTGNFSVQNFYVYGPKKPTLPSGAVELADYYIMGNFAANTVAGLDTISTGVLRKQCTREFFYTGAWALSASSTAAIGGVSAVANPGPGQTIKYTFFGTGFDYRFQTTSGAYSNTISVDGSTNLSAFTTGIYQPGGTALTFTASTGVIGGTGAAGVGAGVRVSGLALGMHTVIITINNGNALFLDAFDIITPIHFPKSNLPGSLQNTSTVGSNSVGDSRTLAELQDSDTPNWAQAFGVTTVHSTTSTTFVPLPEMTVMIKTTGRPVEIDWNLFVNHVTATIGISAQVYVDGVAVGYINGINVSAAGAANEISGSIIVPLAEGTHIVQLMWQTSSGTASVESNRRYIRAREM